MHAYLKISREIQLLLQPPLLLDGLKCECSVSQPFMAGQISIADVSTAFLRGLAFEEIAKVTGEPLREVCFNPPKGSWKLLSACSVMKGCSEVTHVLALIKGVYRLKDALRAWRIKLDMLLKRIKAVPTKSDPCLYMWHGSRGTLLCIASTHADDLKLTGNDDTAKWIITEMEKEV